MLVKDIMSKDIISLSPEDKVSEIISLVENYRIREIPIIENGRLKGIVYAKDIAKKGIQDPSRIKINKIMRYDSPMVSPEQRVEDAAKIIFKTGLRALPVIKKNKVIGIVSMHDIILEVASKTKRFRQTKVEEIMSVPQTITSDTDIGRARVLMREKNISRLPVVDENKKLAGIVTIFDLLKAVKPRERMNFYSMAAEKERVMGIPISTIMNTSPMIVNVGQSLSETTGIIERYNVDGVVVVQDKIPIGIIAEKDLLEVYVSGMKRKGIYYQIIGIDEDDDFVISTIERMVNDTLQKMSKLYNLQFFFLHVKKYDKRGKIKYSIRTRFKTGKGLFVTKAYAWDLRDAVDNALNKIERIMKREKEMKRDKIMEIRKLKKLYR